MNVLGGMRQVKNHLLVFLVGLRVKLVIVDKVDILLLLAF